MLFFELRSSLQPKLDRQSLLAHLVLRFLQKSASAIYAGHSVASARELQRMPFGSTSHIADRLPRLQTKQLFNAIDLPRTLPLVWKLNPFGKERLDHRIFAVPCHSCLLHSGIPDCLALAE
ncbi:MAG: hypothetical protein M3380_09660 [Chloroflexota bacterium]|nr:hypothetical protein [Chloroflexota bacterium]